MGRLNNLDAIETIGSGNSYSSTPIDTSHNASPTPVDNQLYDYSQSQPDPNNLFADDTSSSSESTSSEPAAEEKVEPAAPQNEAERTAAAQAQNSNLYAAIGQDTQPDPVAAMQRDGLDANTQSKLTQVAAMISSGNGTLADLQQNYPSYYNAYMKYYGQPAAQTPAAPTTQAQQPAPQNQILPSAGGNYQADSIYDPSKTYGRQADGSYVYSSSAAQLQRDLNRVMNAGLAVDGYFGQKTQQALNEYLAQNGKQASPTSTPATAETPISGNGSMSAALAASSAEAPKQEQKSNVDQAVQNTGSSSSKPAHDDAWYAEQYEKITGNAPRTDILSPERIRDFVDKELANRPATPEDEGYDAMLQQQALYEQAQEQQRINEMNARRDEAFTPQFINDLRNGKSVEQILNEGDLSYNRWIQDNWDDLAYTYNLGDQSPFESQSEAQGREPINYAAMLDELSQMDRNDWYQRPESRQAGTEREPINYNAMADELAQLERNDWYQRPESQQANGTERTPINYDAMADELFQADRNDWYQRPETPQAPERTPLEYSDAFIRQQNMNDAYSPRQTFNDNYRTELERLQQPQGEVYGSQRNGSVPERYTAPRQPLEYSDAFIRQEEMKDAYSPYADYSGSMASDDIQSSSGTASSDERAMREAYEAAMQSAGRARDIFQGLPTEAEQIQQTREQWQQNMRTALEDQFNNPYMQQFRRDFDDLQRQFPNYSYSALADMVLFNEEMRNGQSSYYKWLTNQL